MVMRDPLPRKAVTGLVIGLVVAFVVVAAIQALAHRPWFVVAVPLGGAIGLGGVAWLALLFKTPGKPDRPKSRKLAGVGR
jgi:hypothetical protein